MRCHQRFTRDISIFTKLQVFAIEGKTVDGQLISWVVVVISETSTGSFKNITTLWGRERESQ